MKIKKTPFKLRPIVNSERRHVNNNRKPMLEIQNLHVNVEDKKILDGLNLTIKPGEVHAIMGPNGSGKSTLANVLAGRETYQVTHGKIQFGGQDLLEMSTELRSREGVFLAFQNPIEIPGVNNMVFLKAALNAKRSHQGLEELDAADFLKLIRQKIKTVKMDEGLLHRSVNEGFSGGEKKRNEILQMAILEPKLAILDETDSGLDVDALQIVSEGINSLRSPDRSIILVTHYQRILNYVVPDYVHILAKGKIIRSGDKALALEIEEKGYGLNDLSQSA
jgi:Fe-S cluster assembly ATP-binding protein